MLDRQSDEELKLWTIGHSTHPWPVFLGMLHELQVDVLVDVRRFAGSRRNPQFSPDAMVPALEAAAIEYRPLPAFGGRRVPQRHSPNDAWRVTAFRGYADHMASAEYITARERLMQWAAESRCAVMCAESLWWQCHRRLIADDFVARGWGVVHIMGAGKAQPHPLNPAARMIEGVLRYPSDDHAQSALF